MITLRHRFTPDGEWHKILVNPKFISTVREQAGSTVLVEMINGTTLTVWGSLYGVNYQIEHSEEDS